MKRHYISEETGGYLVGNSLKGTPVSLKELIYLLRLWELASSSGLMRWGKVITEQLTWFLLLFLVFETFLTTKFIKKRENSMVPEKALLPGVL